MVAVEGKVLHLNLTQIRFFLTYLIIIVATMEITALYSSLAQCVHLLSKVRYH